MSDYGYVDKYAWVILSIHLNEQTLKLKLKKQVQMARKIFMGDWEIFLQINQGQT